MMPLSSLVESWQNGKYQIAEGGFLCNEVPWRIGMSMLKQYNDKTLMIETMIKSTIRFVPAKASWLKHDCRFLF